VSGIVMPFQFGTNWSRYSRMTADVVAPLMAYEGLTAFFLEAGFLGVLLFGRKLVPQWAHFFAAIMVALGTLLSTFWILVVNSWMQTPAGFSLQDGRFFPDDWLAVILNPSFPFRFAHTVTAVYLTTAFTVIGVAAYHLRNRRFVEESRVMMVMGISLATILVPLQALIGDAHGINTLEHQPIKLAAIEGIWETQSGVPAVIFAIPDAKTESIEKEEEDGKTIYDFEMKLGKVKWEADVAEDGTLIETEQQIEEKDAPPAVMGAVKQKFPHGNIKEVMAKTKGEEKTVHEYEVVVRDEAKDHELTISPDGKIKEEGAGDEAKDKDDKDKEEKPK